MYSSSVAGHLRVEVKHRWPAPTRYTWEIYREHKALPVEEARDWFGSWEEASQAGRKALQKLSSRSICRPWLVPAREQNVQNSRP